MLDADEDRTQIKACEHFQVGSRNAGFRKRTCAGDESTNQIQVFGAVNKVFSWSPVQKFACSFISLITVSVVSMRDWVCEVSNCLREICVTDLCDHVRNVMAEQAHKHCILFVMLDRVVPVDRITYRDPGIRRPACADSPARYDCHPPERHGAVAGLDVDTPSLLPCPAKRLRGP